VYAALHGATQRTLTAHLTRHFRILCIAVLLLAAGSYLLSTLRWPWMWDTQVMHYVTFLLDHGKAPYREILDINMPGSYLTEKWAVAIFGSGDLGWRLYEFTLLAVMTLAMIVIALPYDWFAGLFAGVLFTLLHGTEGPYNAAQRDEVMTVLLLVGYAFLFGAVRRRLPVLMVPAGLSLGLAALIKPTVVPFAFVLLLLPVVVFRKDDSPPWTYVLFGIAGMVFNVGFLLALLLPQHSVGSFLFMLQRTMPYYSALARPTFGYVFRHSLPQTFLFYAPIAIVLAIANHHRVDWDVWAIRLGCVFGAVSYFVQRKGYTYHRYSYLAFALLWIGLEFTAAMKERGLRRNLGVAGMGFAVLLMAPFNAYKVSQFRYTNQFADQLETDLTALGGSHLNGKIQCLDVVSGCFRALYRLNLVESTGFTGDLQFFAPDDGKIVSYYRKIFWNDIHDDPPAVVILSDEWYATGTYTFDKLNAWPQLRDYLNSAYDLQLARDFGSFQGNDIAYRIYALKGGLKQPSTSSAF
jgi:hypothetical protein